MILTWALRLRKAIHLFLLVLFLLMVFDGEADAQTMPTPKPVTNGQIQASLDLAERVWRPACGDLSVRFITVAEANVTFTKPPNGEHPGKAVAWASKGDCVISIEPEFRTMHRKQMCDTILHEAGHVAGYRDSEGDPLHSSNPNSAMWPFAATDVGYDGQRKRFLFYGIDRRCR